MANETMDFLTALASRNGLAAGDAPPAVQPRIASRFEPVAPDAGAGLIESSAETEAARDERHTAQTQAAAPTDTPATSARSAPSSTLTPSPTQTARPTPASMHPALRIIERVVHARETQTIRVVERGQLTEHVPRRDVFGGDEVAGAPSPATAPAQTATPTRQPQPTQPTSAFAPKPPVATKPPTPADKPPAAAPQPPDVHISIGRIEVRANPAAMKGKPRNKPTVPDLERYLNSLSGTSNNGGDG